MSQTAELTKNEKDGCVDQLVAQAKIFPWHQIYSPTEQDAIDFYTRALDWDTTEFPMECGSYKMLTANGMPVAGVIGTNEAEKNGFVHVPPHWAVSISVDDVDARVARCENLGGKLLHGPMDVPTVGRIALVADPNGATFWLFKGECS